MKSDLVCGIDEAGRGCVCGSLFVAGFVCEQNDATELLRLGIKDSKKTTKQTRAVLSQKLKDFPHSHSHVVSISARQIDTLGISKMMKMALEEIIQVLQPFSERFIFDGSSTFGLNLPNLSTLIKGDNLIPQISAASILAKNAKDVEMENLHRLYPEYGFLSHSGYGTKMHLDAIAKLGLTKLHRRSFLKKYGEENKQDSQGIF